MTFMEHNDIIHKDWVALVGTVFERNDNAVWSRDTDFFFRVNSLHVYWLRARMQLTILIRFNNICRSLSD